MMALDMERPRCDSGASELVSGGTVSEFTEPDHSAQDLPACLAPYAGQKRFVGWRWEKRRNKRGEEHWTKPPIIVHGGKLIGHASSNNPETWATLQEAQEALATGRLEGVGLQLLGLIGFAAIDLDNVRDPDTGAILPWASRLVEASNSYAEVTPSGKGLRILGTVTERFPATHTERGHGEGGEFEIFANMKTGRYITVSGERLPDAPDALAPLDALLRDLLEVKPPPADAARKWRDFNDAPLQEGAFLFDEGNDLPEWLLDKIAHGASGDRSADFQSIANSLFIRGVSFDEALRLFEEHPDGPAEKYVGRLEAELRRSWQKAEASADPVSHVSHVSHGKGEPPQPLIRNLPEGEPYPAEALGPLKEVVEAVQGLTLAPIAIPAASALSVASLAVQGHADVETLDGTRPLSLYMLTIARSGERKTSCDAPLMAGLRAFEREESRSRRSDLSSWENSYALWKGERDRILAEAKRGKGEKRIAAQADLEALGAEPAAPPSPDRTVTEPTFEGLTRKFIEGMPSLGIFSDEGGQFLGGHAMNTDNRQKTLAALNDLWQAHPIQRTRAGDGSHTLYGRRLCAHLMVQPGIARSFMADPLAADSGFLPRFLICEPASTIGTRLQSRVRPDEVALPAFTARLREVLETAMPMDPETRELEPRTLYLSQDARAMLAEFSDKIEVQQAPGGQYADVIGYASKAAEQAARIAGVLTIWRDLHAPEVSGRDMEHGITLAQFYLAEAARLANAATISAEIERAETLRKWLLEEWPHPEILVRDVLRLGPGRSLRESPVAKAAIEMLARHGWLIRMKEGTIIRGAPRKEAWSIVRSDAE